MKRLCLLFALLAAVTVHAAPPPEVFAPGVVSGPAHEAAPVFSANGRTLWFGRSDGPQSTILESRLTAAGWSAPVTAPFSGRWSDMEPALSPDGRFLVFVSNRPKQDGGAPLDGFFMGRKHPGGGGNLWRMERTAAGWSAPQRLPDVVNASDSTFAPAIAADGTLYFMRPTPDGRHFRIYSARAKADGGYEAPEALPFSDGLHTDVDPAVAPDQSYLVFGSSRPPARGMDLFIAFREDGRWGRPRHLGDVVNAPGSDAEPRLSPDGRTLYFSSERRVPGVETDWNNGKYNVWAVPMGPLLAEFGPKRAGELALTLPHPAAAPRGATELRALVWYPAVAEAREAEAKAGPAFAAGRVAPGAGWASMAPHPLVLLSHGFGGAARQMTWLGEALARAGYVAVAVDHPGTNGIDGVNAAGAYAPWERASDLSLALDRVLAHPAIGPQIDRNRIGVAGFSIGGWTTALLIGATADFDRFRAFCRSPERDSICDPQVEFDLNYLRQHEELKRAGAEGLLAGERKSWRDGRIKSAVLIAPALAQALDPASLAGIKLPTLFIAGDSDRVVPTPTNAAWLQARVGGAKLQVLPGVGHYDFLSLCTPAGRELVPRLCEEAGPPRRLTHEMTTAAVLDFFATTLQPSPR